MNNNKNVVVLGASVKSERYSNMAVSLLAKKGYNVIPVHPSGLSVNGLKTYKSLSEVNLPIDTISMYVNPKQAKTIRNEIIQSSPKRVIFNPGTEDNDLEKECRTHNIIVEEACTLVLLKTDSFNIER